MQVVGNVAVRVEIELDFELPLIAVCPRRAHARDRRKCRFKRIGDARADLLGREIACVGEHLDASKRNRRKDALRRRDEAPASEPEAAEYREENESRQF
jgi:hypothetical protein